MSGYKQLRPIMFSYELLCPVISKHGQFCPVLSSYAHNVRQLPCPDRVRDRKQAGCAACDSWRRHFLASLEK